MDKNIIFQFTGSIMFQIKMIIKYIFYAKIINIVMFLIEWNIYDWKLTVSIS